MNGRCVKDGPFHDLEVLYIRDRPDAHCLSRSFADDEKLARLAEDVRPEAITRLLNICADYNSLYLELENRAHNAIPHSVGGDFEFFSAPYGE